MSVKRLILTLNALRVIIGLLANCYLCLREKHIVLNAGSDCGSRSLSVKRDVDIIISIGRIFQLIFDLNTAEKVFTSQVTTNNKVSPWM
jgi:hypothetical protein